MLMTLQEIERILKECQPTYKTTVKRTNTYVGVTFHETEIFRIDSKHNVYINAWDSATTRRRLNLMFKALLLPLGVYRKNWIPYVEVCNILPKYKQRFKTSLQRVVWVPEYGLFSIIGNYSNDVVQLLLDNNFHPGPQVYTIGYKELTKGQNYLLSTIGETEDTTHALGGEREADLLHLVDQGYVKIVQQQAFVYVLRRVK